MIGTRRERTALQGVCVALDGQQAAEKHMCLYFDCTSSVIRSSYLCNQQRFTPHPVAVTRKCSPCDNLFSLGAASPTQLKESSALELHQSIERAPASSAARVAPAATGEWQRFARTAALMHLRQNRHQARP